MEHFLEERLDVDFEMRLPTNYAGVIEALRSATPTRPSLLVTFVVVIAIDILSMLVRALALPAGSTLARTPITAGIVP